MLNDGLKNTSIGVDIEEVKRFEGLTAEKDARFLNKIFTKNELDYCYGRANTAQHLAARFAAKEAVIKALSSLGKDKITYHDIEITNNDKGVPSASFLKNGFKNLQVLVSMSHTEGNAIAFALAALKTEE